MLAVTTSGWWVIGAAIAAAVVLVAAVLLFAIIGLGRRIVRQAGEIVAALDGARANTNALFDVTKTNLAIDQITHRLASVREELEAG
jgi:hypothetical protein